ncbi:FAD-dependent oxidoreductase [Pseudonocardia xinjiangensis]|uniref:FAD-dependent oxidoreductase n=1 Tax=Pseudonocardia xinjiangensis TaxID=75289 RepID=UPI003D8A8EBA
MGLPDVLVCGAGIAGLTLAYWLSRHGFPTTVVERAPALRAGGQSVDLRGAGFAVVERMGLLDRMGEVALDHRGFAWVDAVGRVTARIPAELFGTPERMSKVEVLRGDLVRVLHDVGVGAVEYLFDDTISAIVQDGGGVTVSFRKAGRRRYGLVLGADGVHSVVRRLVFGPEARCVRAVGGYTAWFTAPDAGDLDGWFVTHNAPGGRAVSLRSGRSPGESKARLSFTSAPGEHDRHDVAAQQDLVARRFAGVGWKAPALLGAMRAASDFRFDSISQVRLARWSRGRVGLVGDAGYCPTLLTGLGTSLAIVGAYVLAGELAAAGGDHRAGFARYEQVLRPYVRRGQSLPLGMHGFAPTGAGVIRLQAASIRCATSRPLRGLLARQLGRVGQFALPDYGRD